MDKFSFLVHLCILSNKKKSNYLQWYTLQSSLPKTFYANLMYWVKFVGLQCIFNLPNVTVIWQIIIIIIWLALWAGKMNQIARCDCLPQRARWSYPAGSGLPAVSRKKNFSESHIINHLLTKLIRSRWLDIGFFNKHAKKNLANIPPSWPHVWSITHISLYSKLTLTPLFIHRLLSSYLSITITIVKPVILFHKKTT